MAMRLIVFLLVLAGWPQLTQASLTSVSPNTAQLAVPNLTTTISSTGDFVQSASPNGNVYSIELRSGSSVYTLADGWSQFPSSIFSNGYVIDPNTFQLSNLTLPITVPVGTYSLYVGYLDPLFQGFQTYPSYYDSLPNSFTVLPPDGYIQGHLFLDLNQNGQLDAGEPPFTGGSVLLVELATVLAVNSNGDFSAPVANGTYTIRYSSYSYDKVYLTTSQSEYIVTVNNNTVSGLLFGVRRKLESAFPSQLVAGQIQRFTLLSDSLFSPAAGTLNSVTLQRQTPTSNITTYSANITVLDTNTASMLVTVPSTASGIYNAIAYFNSGPNYGQHFLFGCVNIVQPNAFITGRIYYDANGNGVYDSGEPPLPYQRIRMMPGDAYAYSDASGNYSIGALNGSYNISWYPPAGSNFVLSSGTSSYTVVVPGTTTGYDFGLRTTLADYTSTVAITSTRPRCNSTNIYTLTYQNVSNIPYNGRLYLLRDPQTGFVGSSVAPSGSTVSGDSIWWDLNNLQPFVPSTLTSNLLMPGPNTTLVNRVSLTSYDASATPQLSSQGSVTEAVLCSFDPNDKGCTPEGAGQNHFTLLSDPLEYLIRFQNTGNDTAYDVRVYDRLDTALDWSSMEILTSSHTVRTSMDSSGLITFFFPNIYLPDSNVDEEHSHGFIRYRIRAKASTPDYTLVENTAHIVFDLNPPVITNTTFNTMVQSIPLWVKPTGGQFDGVSVYPNPTSDRVEISFAQEPSGAKLAELFDALGQSVLRQKIQGRSCLLDVRELPEGVYIIRVTDESGATVFSGKLMRN